MANGFTAACVSYGGLVRALGTTLPAMVSETATGLMVLKNSDDLITRTKAQYPEGPTGGWSAEWWHVWNYLQYNVGACIVGGSGSVWGLTMDTYANYTPLHSTTEPFNCIFNLDPLLDPVSPVPPGYDNNPISGNFSSALSAAQIALQRKDVYAIMGASDSLRYYHNTGEVAGAEARINGWTAGIMRSFFGLRYGSSTPLQNVYCWPQGVTMAPFIAVLGVKNFIKSWSNAGYDFQKVSKQHIASDFAGCMGRAITNGFVWDIPAGLVKGRILNAIKLEYEYTDAQRKNAATEGRIVVPQTIPGKGIFFMSDLTQADPNASVTKMSFQSVIAYLRKTIKDVAFNYLFEPNGPNTRNAFKSYTEGVLAAIQSSGSITYYRVECDATNNTDPNKLYARIIIQPADRITSISLEVAVTNDGGVTVSATDITTL